MRGLSSFCLVVVLSILFVLPQAAEAHSPRDVADFVCELSSAPRFTVEERANARATISDALTELGLQPVEMPYQWDPNDFPWLLPYPPELQGFGTNLTAVLPATEASDRWVVLGAHYDTVQGSPGAEDNATGVAAVLAAAHELLELETRPVNVMLMFFDQEEPGLVGSIMGMFYLAMGSGIVPEQAHLADSCSWDGDGDKSTQVIYWYDPGACNPELPPEQQDPNCQPVDYLPLVLPLYEAAKVELDASLPPPMRSGPLTTANWPYSDHAGVIVAGMMLGGFVPAVTVGAEWADFSDYSPYMHSLFGPVPDGSEDTCEHVDVQQLLRNAGMLALAVDLYMNP
jgi:hypothetical protein